MGYGETILITRSPHGEHCSYAVRNICTWAELEVISGRVCTCGNCAFICI